MSGNEFEMFVFRSTRGGLMRVTRLAAADGVMETWLAKPDDAEAMVLARWSDEHVRALGFRPYWRPDDPGRPRRIPIEVVES